MNEELVSGLLVSEHPNLRQPVLITAFAGWPDAGEVATGSLRYLIASLNARKFAYMDADTYYDYCAARPTADISRGLVRSIREPASEFYYWRNPSATHDLVLLLAAEPQLRWRRYLRSQLALISSLGVEMVICLGGMFDAVPHSVPPRVTGSATSEAMRERLVEAGVALSDYQGPISIHTPLMLACQQAGVESGSIWGHTPHYVRTVANPRVCHAMLSKTLPLAGVELPLDDLLIAGQYLDASLNRMASNNAELADYIRRLEERHAAGTAAEEEYLQDTERIIRDVERFLKGENKQG